MHAWLGRSKGRKGGKRRSSSLREGRDGPAEGREGLREGKEALGKEGKVQGKKGKI